MKKPKRHQRSKKKGKKFEDKVQKTMNSGALDFDKGDLKTDDYVIECKFTDKKSYRLSAKTLQKIWNEALESNKLPGMVVGIDGEDCRWMLTININREVK